MGTGGCGVFSGPGCCGCHTGWLLLLCGGGWCLVGLCGGVGLCVENCIVDASILFVVKCVRADVWMPWHQEPMKDVGGRDRPGGAVNRAVIPGCPNGVTRHQLCGVTRA